MIEAGIAAGPEIVASHYDELDEFYREIWGLHVHHGYWDEKETNLLPTEALIEHLIRDVKFPARVCDIGCGYGTTARYLAEKYNADVTGFSISEGQINFAKKFGDHSGVKLILRDWMDNQLESESFDLVISIESSEHMPDLKRFIQEAYRVLRPGGQFKVCAWLSVTNPKDWELDHFLRPICREGRLHLGDKEEYISLMEEFGLKDIHFEDITENVKKTWTYCITGFLKKLFTDSKYFKYLLQSSSQNRDFLFSLPRIRLAYETGSLRYGMFSARKAGDF